MVRPNKVVLVVWMLIKVITRFPLFSIIFFYSPVLLSVLIICHSKIKEGFVS